MKSYQGNWRKEWAIFGANIMQKTLKTQIQKYFKILSHFHMSMSTEATNRLKSILMANIYKKQLNSVL